MVLAAAARRRRGDGRAGEIADAKSSGCSATALLLGRNATWRSGPDRMASRRELPLEVEEFLSWLVSERGGRATRSPPTGGTSSPTNVAGTARPRCHVDTAISSTSSASARRGATASSIARAAGRHPHAAPPPRHREARADDPDGRSRGRPCAARLPKPLTEDEVTSAARRRRRQRARWTGATGRCSSCCTRPARGSPRLAGCRWATSTSTSARAAVRQGRKERIVPFGRRGGGARRVVRAAGRAGAGAVATANDAEAVFLNRRGGGSAVRRRGRSSRHGGGRDPHGSVAARAAPLLRAPTCSTTAPTCASSRSCSGTPRSRRPRCTRRPRAPVRGRLGAGPTVGVHGACRRRRAISLPNHHRRRGA